MNGQINEQGLDVGVIPVPGFGYINASQWIEDGIYDTVTIASGAVTAGTEYEFFSSLANKGKDDTNMAEANKLPEGWEIIIIKMGLEILPSANLLDIQAFAERSHLRFETGNTKIRRRAPTYCWPICFGMNAMHVLDTQASTLRKGILQIGGVGFGGAPNLLLPVRISPRLNFKTVLNITDAQTFNADFRIRFWLYGYVSRPVQ